MPITAVLQRTSDTFASLRSLERYQGHFYNWYDTQTLLPLSPRYISSVDSGNLAGHLLTLRAGLLALPDAPLVDVRVFQGAADTLALIERAFEGDAAPPSLRQLRSELASAVQQAGAADAPGWLPRLASAVDRLLADPVIVASADALFWAQALARQSRQWLDEWEYFLPHLAGGLHAANLGSELTLRAVAGIDPMQLPAEQQPLAGRARARALEAISLIETLAQQADGFAQMQYEYDRAVEQLKIKGSADADRLDRP